MSSKKDTWKKHISRNLVPYLYLVDEKYIGLTEDDKETRKNILKEKQVYENYLLHKEKKKNKIRNLMDRGDSFIKSKNMSSYTKAKELKIIYNCLVKVGAPKVGLQYLLYSLQQRELSEGKTSINVLNEYYKYDLLVEKNKKK